MSTARYRTGAAAADGSVARVSRQRRGTDMQDAWRAYLEMALGLTEVPRKRAQKVAGELVNRGGATATQLQGLVEDLMSTSMANRAALTNIVRFEVDRAL